MIPQSSSRNYPSGWDRTASWRASVQKGFAVVLGHNMGAKKARIGPFERSGNIMWHARLLFSSIGTDHSASGCRRIDAFQVWWHLWGELEHEPRPGQTGLICLMCWNTLQQTEFLSASWRVTTISPWYPAPSHMINHLLSELKQVQDYLPNYGMFELQKQYPGLQRYVLG